MGLAASQARLLTYTRRKADCELRISQNSSEKMALAREQSKLSREYQSLLNSRRLSYVSNGEYHKLDYRYLMGCAGKNAFWYNDNIVKKGKYNMILTDSRGLVVLSSEYAKFFQEAGAEEGRPFPVKSDIFTQILSRMSNVPQTDICNILDNEDCIRKINGTTIKSVKDEVTGEYEDSIITTDQKWSDLQYWYPIVLAAATNGWTAEYANQMEKSSTLYAGEDYLGDGIQSGMFNLVLVDEDGTYKPDIPLDYFLTASATTGIAENYSTEDKEKLTAWFNAEHDRINEKETYLDLELTDLSTELEAIKTAIQSIESYTQDAITSIFDWGSG